MSDNTIAASDHIQELLSLKDKQKNLTDEMNSLSRKAEVAQQEFMMKLREMVVRDELRTNVVYMYNGKGYMVKAKDVSASERHLYDGRIPPTYTLECYEIGN